MTRRQLLLTSTAVLPPERPEPDGWYGAVDDGYGSSVVAQIRDAGAKMDAAFGYQEGWGQQKIEQAIAGPLRKAELERHRRGLRSDAMPRVICPA